MTVAAQATVICSPTICPCLPPCYLGDRREQEDPSSGIDRSTTLERMARERPPVLSMKRLRKVSETPILLFFEKKTGETIEYANDTFVS